MDVDSIDPGIDFIDLIDSTLDNSAVVVVIIGPGWLHARDASGADRLGQTDDFVHMEVRRALELDKRVIPVLVDGAHFPAAEELPPDLVSLARRNAFDVSDARFHSDADRLVTSIERVLAAAAAAAPASTAAASTEPTTPTVEPVVDEPGPQPSPEPGNRRRWALVAAIAGAVLVIAVIVGVIVSSGGGGQESQTSDTTAATEAATEATETAATDTAASGGDAGAPAAPALASSIASGSHPVDLEVVGDSLWVQVDGGLERYDASGDDPTVLGHVNLEPNGQGNDIIPDGDFLDVTLAGAGEVAVVDPTTGNVDERIPVDGAPLAGAVLGDTLWVTVRGDFGGKPGALVPITSDGVGSPIPLDDGPNGVVAYENALWVTFAETDHVAYVDPDTEEVIPYPVGPNPVDVQAVNHQLWVTLSGANQVAIVDPSSGNV